MTTGIWGKGVVVAREDDAVPGTFVPIAGIAGVTPFSTEREEIDVTAHDTPGPFQKFVGGLVDAGALECEILFNPANHFTLYADFKEPNPINYQITFPGGGTVDMAALLTGYEPEFPTDDKATASVTWKISGEPTLTPPV